MFFEGSKQLEYKAYINLTLSAVLAGIFINLIDKIDYFQGKAKIFAIVVLLVLSLLNLCILIFSVFTLRKFDIKNYLSYDFLNIEDINNSLLLKDKLLTEILEKYAGLTAIYNFKVKNLDRSTKLLVLELGIIFGMILFSIIETIDRLLK